MKLFLHKHIYSLCPKCETPGYIITDIETGLPCAWCRTPSQEIQAEIYSCTSCGYSEKRPATQKNFADPGNCSFCNP